MRAVAIKLNNFVKSVDVINNCLEKTLFKFLVWSFAALTIAYVAFLAVTVTNIIERKSVEAESRKLESEVGELEIQYLSMSGKVDYSLSQTLGFKETKTVFATRKSVGLKAATKASQNDL